MSEKIEKKAKKSVAFMKKVLYIELTKTIK